MSRSPFFSLFLLLGTTSWMIMITNQWVLTPAFYRHSGQELTLVPGLDVSVNQQLQLRIYAMSALYLLVKITLISLILYVALYLSGHFVKYAKIFSVVNYSELIFVLFAFFKLIWFKIGYSEGTLQDWHHLYILSVLSLFSHVPADWSYVLQSMNVAEVLYWLLLAAGISRLVSIHFIAGFRLVALSYVSALFIWIIAITFLSLLFFPNHA